MNEMEECYNDTKILTSDELQQLEKQNSRLVTQFQATLLEKDAKKFWDLFYKRNENRFFKDRHWTTREFKELLNFNSSQPRILLEVGCGVGNFVFPIIEEGLNFNIVACDLSPRAIEIVRQHPSYDDDKIKAFQADITETSILETIPKSSVDVCTLVFVLSAIHPEKFVQTLRNLNDLLKPGGILLFRDYGLYDMAQLRFKAGHKIADNFYMRQDGTRSYYFSTQYAEEIFKAAGFNVTANSYIHRRTINKKENIDVPRIFIQIKAVKKTIT